MMKIRALIFDFDGLILDTEIPVFEAWKNCFAAHGHELDLAEYVGCVGSDFGGFDPVDRLETIHDQLVDWPFWDQWRSEYVRKMIRHQGPLPGVREMLEAARAEGTVCAVASSSPRRWVIPLLDRLELREFFPVIRCLDDVAKPKPSPELFLAAAIGLGVHSSEAVVFEDSLNGLKAAQASGMRCVIVPNSITADLDFSAAALKARSLADLSLTALRELLETQELARGS